MRINRNNIEVHFRATAIFYFICLVIFSMQTYFSHQLTLVAFSVIMLWLVSVAFPSNVLPLLSHCKRHSLKIKACPIDEPGLSNYKVGKSNLYSMNPLCLRDEFGRQNNRIKHAATFQRKMSDGIVWTDYDCRLWVGGETPSVYTVSPLISPGCTYKRSQFSSRTSVRLCMDTLLLLLRSFQKKTALIKNQLLEISIQK